jgi:CubicO group peptidase (beta-lactamase class C family)
LGYLRKISVRGGLSLVLSAALSAGLFASAMAAAESSADQSAVNLKGDRETLRLLDAWLDSEQAYRRIPALSVAIVQGDKILWSKGYGTLDANHQIPATAQTLYSICSISKLFTSMALMQLWEAGRVRLDEPVTTYLPWLQLKPLDQAGALITLRGILTHSSGLPREADYPYWTGPNFSFPSQEQLKSSLQKLTPLWPTERYYQYSNLGLTLIGDTVAAVSGEPYEGYAESHILTPLGLKDTHPFIPSSLYGTRLAVGWGALTRQGTREMLPPVDARALTPAVGYSSTA